MEAILYTGRPYVSGTAVALRTCARLPLGAHGGGHAWQDHDGGDALDSIFEYAGMAPGFLIGGVPMDFNVSARLTDSAFFVIEGDEYDTAFFDKRSKFVHYRPRTAIINNLEYDHADIFP